MLYNAIIYSIAETKCMFHSGHMYYAGQKIQKSSFKRRKLFERFQSASHGGEMRSEMLSMSPEKSLKGETGSSATALNGLLFSSDRSTGLFFAFSHVISLIECHSLLQLEDWK